MMLAGITMLLTWGTVAGTASRQQIASGKVTTYVPRSASACESAATRSGQAARKYCKKCITNAALGAAEKVTVQVGGCGKNTGSLTSVADFTAAAVNLYVPVTIDGNLIVTGTSTHEGLETFLGNIATNVVYSTDRGSVSVQIPGPGQNSTQIGPGSKGYMCAYACLPSSPLQVHDSHGSIPRSYIIMHICTQAPPALTPALP